MPFLGFDLFSVIAVVVSQRVLRGTEWEAAEALADKSSPHNQQKLGSQVASSVRKVSMQLAGG